MRSEIMGSNGEGPTINEGVEEFSVFLENRIFHSIWASIKLRFATCTGVPKKRRVHNSLIYRWILIIYTPN
jgi:hypothetical protein